jgi:hypothetical protein
MSIFGINFIILNSMQATKDLLEKRGKIYSARMSLPMFDIAEYTKLVAFETNTKRCVLSRLILPTTLPARTDQSTPLYTNQRTK